MLLFARKILFGLFILLVLSSTVQTSSSKSLEVGILDFPPCYFAQVPDKVGGVLLGLLTKVLQRARIGYYVKAYPPKKLYKNLALGKTNIWLGSRGVPAYEKKVLYSRFSIGQVELRFYAIGQKPFPKVEKDLFGKKIITMRGYAYCGFVKFLENPQAEIRIIPAGSRREAFLMLEKGKADYLLEYKRPAEAYLKGHRIQNLRYRVFTQIDLYFVISKKTPGAERVLLCMEEAYRQLKEEGKIEF